MYEIWFGQNIKSSIRRGSQTCNFWPFFFGPPVINGNGSKRIHPIPKLILNIYTGKKKTSKIAGLKTTPYTTHGLICLTDLLMLQDVTGLPSQVFKGNAGEIPLHFTATITNSHPNAVPIPAGKGNQVNFFVEVGKKSQSSFFDRHDRRGRMLSATWKKFSSYPQMMNSNVHHVYSNNWRQRLLRYICRTWKKK